MAGKTIVLQFGEQRVLLRCPESYDAASSLASKEFRINMLKTLEFYVDMSALEPGSTLGQVQLSPSTWSLLLQTAGTVVVDVRVKERQANGASNSGIGLQSESGVVSQSMSAQQIRIKACALSGGQDFHFVISCHTRIHKLLESLSSRIVVDAKDVFLSFHGSPLAADQTLSELGVVDGDILDYGTLPSAFRA